MRLLLFALLLCALRTCGSKSLSEQHVTQRPHCEVRSSRVTHSEARARKSVCVRRSGSETSQGVSLLPHSWLPTARERTWTSIKLTSTSASMASVNQVNTPAWRLPPPRGRPPAESPTSKAAGRAVGSSGCLTSVLSPPTPPLGVRVYTARMWAQMRSRQCGLHRGGPSNATG